MSVRRVDGRQDLLEAVEGAPAGARLVLFVLPPVGGENTDVYPSAEVWASDYAWLSALCQLYAHRLVATDEEGGA